jgi:hypothetical protein
MPWAKQNLRQTKMLKWGFDKSLRQIKAPFVAECDMKSQF